MNEAQKMAKAIREVMAFDKDALVDMLICLAAVAPADFLSDVAERARNPSLKPGYDTLGSPTLIKVVAPAIFGNPAVESTWTKEEIEKIKTDAHVGGWGGTPNKIIGIKLIRQFKGLGLADAKHTYEHMENMGLFR